MILIMRTPNKGPCFLGDKGVVPASNRTLDTHEQIQSEARKPQVQKERTLRTQSSQTCGM